MTSETGRTQMTVLKLESVVLLDRTLVVPLNRPLDFDLSFGEIGMIEGANGVGKSSLLRSIREKKSSNVYSGSISIGIDFENISFLPQLTSPRIPLPMTLEDVATLRLNNDTDTLDRILDSDSMAHDLDLSRPWNTCSGGERQRLLLACLLATTDLNRPRLLVLDEPTNHLDIASRTKIANEIRKWISAAPEKRSALIVSHDLVSLLEDGAIPVRILKMVSP